MAEDAPSEDSILKAFEQWDQDGDGQISRGELATVLRRLNPALVLADLDALFDVCDANQNGVLEYEEFLMFLNDGVDAAAAADIQLGHVNAVISGNQCASGCGRPPCPGFRTCCRSCPFVKKKERKFGHDMRCEILHNGGLAFPWYWHNYTKAEDDFHDTDEGEYVQKMGTRLISQSIEGATVLKCIRVENSSLWRKYARRRAEIRGLQRSQMGATKSCGSGHALSSCDKAPTKEDDTPRCFVCRRPGSAYTCEACSYDVCRACYEGSGLRVGNVVKANEGFTTYASGDDNPAFNVEPGWTGTITNVDWEGDALIKFDDHDGRRFINCSAHASKLEVTRELDPPKTRNLLGFSATTTLDDAANEAWLFHGTCEAAARGITESNFRIPDKPDSATHGALFGQGAYLAEAAKKSHVYSQPDGPDGCYVMLLCRAALGKCKPVGGCDENAERYVRQDDAYDALIGFTALENSGYAREFLVYDAEQVYPEYIMYYKVPE